MLRADEMEDSRELVRLVLSCSNREPGGAHLTSCEPRDGEAIGCSEGWRGQHLDWLRLKDGVIDRAVIRDPSFCNWPLFAEIGPGNIVPDFPLCNKSLNLSYSGTDL
jgi:Ni,Fe-hydrogenase III large subunit